MKAGTFCVFVVLGSDYDMLELDTAVGWIGVSHGLAWLQKGMIRPPPSAFTITLQYNNHQPSRCIQI